MSDLHIRAGVARPVTRDPDALLLAMGVPLLERSRELGGGTASRWAR